MKKAIFSLCALSITSGGCSKIDDWRHPDAAACKKYITGGLRSPSTYSEVSRTFSKVDGAENRHFTSVTLSYDAANAYGTPVRSAETCEFEVDDKGKFVREPEFSAVMAGADRALGRESGKTCCLSPTITGANDPLLMNMTIDDVPKENEAGK